MTESGRTRFLLAAWALAPLSFAVLAWGGWSPPRLCVWSRIFGIRCPGCGMVHAAQDLARLDPAGAWRHNPLSFVVLPLCAFLYLRWGHRIRFGRKPS